MLVPSWFIPPALAASGSITMPAVASADVRNIKAFDGHTNVSFAIRGMNGRVRRFMIRASSGAPTFQPCPEMGLRHCWRSVWGTTDKNPVIAETKIRDNCAHFGNCRQCLRSRRENAH